MCNTLLTIQISSEQFKKIMQDILGKVMNSGVHRHWVCRAQQLDGKQEHRVSVAISKIAYV
jgi:hypothetical protein